MQCRLFYITNRFNSSFIKDSYKVLGFASPFTDEENIRILQRINSGSSPEHFRGILSKPRAGILSKWLEVNGPFVKLENLLDLNKFEPKVLVTMGKKILQEEVHPTIEGSEDTLDSDPSNNKDYLKKCIHPRFKYNSSTTDFVAFRIYQDSIAYSHYNRISKTIIDMKILSFSNSLTKPGIELYKIHDDLSQIIEKFPTADFYIFEKSPPITARDSSINFRVHLQMIETIFQCLIYNVKFMATNESVVPKAGVFYSIKPALINTLFKLSVGTERIAGSSRVLDVLRGKENIDLKLFIDEALFTEEFINKSNVNKEKLSQVILLSSAFNYLYKKKIKVNEFC